MSTLLKTYPFIFNYKSINFSITENDTSFLLEITSKYMIHTSYTPKTIKGNKINAKIIFSQSEKLGSKDNGVTMHITLNSDYGWFCSLVENENGITLEIHTGEHQFTMDQSLKNINHASLYTLNAHIPK